MAKSKRATKLIRGGFVRPTATDLAEQATRTRDALEGAVIIRAEDAPKIAAQLKAIDELRAALGDVIAIIDQIGGYMTAEDQHRLRNARRVHGGS